MSGPIRGHTMDVQLTIPAIARRAETLAPRRAVVSSAADGSLRRDTWASTLARSRRLAVALAGLGVRAGDRIGTLCWNQREHLEAYFGVPALGAVLHTLNPRVADEDLAFMLADADTRVVIVDAMLADQLARVRASLNVEHVIVVDDDAREGALCYEELLAASDVDCFDEPQLDERDACALCYTSGATGQPKGVLYSHRAIALQSLATMAVDFGGICEADTILVPMFHANAWGHPYSAALAGSALVLPHRDVRPARVLELIEGERVTTSGGVPTVWQDVLAHLDEHPGRYDLSSVRILRIGGGAHR